MYKERILKLTRAFYPGGRAFKMFPKSYLESIHKAFSEVENKAYKDALSILDSALPDNSNFTENDANLWEVRLGMVSGIGVDLELRKAAIRRKMAFPSDTKARQHRVFLEGNLRAAGFDVYVYENRFDDGMGGIVTKTPEDIGGFQHGEFEHGENEHGDYSSLKCVNFIEEIKDATFDIGNNYRSTFFIASANFGTYNSKGVITLAYPVANVKDLFAEVPLERKIEFRKLILSLKPAHTVGLLFVNYV